MIVDLGLWLVWLLWKVTVAWFIVAASICVVFVVAIIGVWVYERILDSYDEE